MVTLGEWEMAGRLLLAALLGGAIGLEREVDGQDAGLRTHLMVALGAALFGVVSVGGFDAFTTRGGTNVQVDVTRVASYVAAGVGFLGGGAILKHAGGVRGLTTASSLWVVAAVGLAAGLGLWFPAAVATVAALLSLAALKPARRAVRRFGRQGDRLVVVLVPGASPTGVVQALHEGLPVTPVAVEIGRGDADRLEIAAEFAPNEERDLLARSLDRIVSRTDVADVRLGRA